MQTIRAKINKKHSAWVHCADCLSNFEKNLLRTAACGTAIFADCAATVAFYFHRAAV